MQFSEAVLVEASERNGRQMAEVAVLFLPLPWSEAQYLAVLDRAADALADSFPGGLADFLAVVDVVTSHARSAFDRRLAEISQHTDGFRSCAH